MSFYRWVDADLVIKPPTMIRIFVASVVAFFLMPFIVAGCFLLLQIVLEVMTHMEQFSDKIDIMMININFFGIGVPAILIATWLIAFDESTDFLIWTKLPLYHADMLPPQVYEQEDPHAAFKPPRR